MALLDDIGTALTNASVVDGSSWTLGKSYMPDSPDQMVVVYESGGRDPETALSYDRPNFQVVVRGSELGYSAARTKMAAVFAALHAQESDVGADYVTIEAVGDVLPMGYDENRRPRLSLNFRVEKAR